MGSSTSADAFGLVRTQPGRPERMPLFYDLTDIYVGPIRLGVEPPSNYDRAVPHSLAHVLRSRGMRMTPQRQLVLDAVRQLEHATPEQVHATVAQTADSVNITTVYRTLELLEELGLVTHTHLSHGAPTYHVAGEDQHIHLVCRRCGIVEGVEPNLLQTVSDDLKAQRGFVVDIAHVAFFGLCAECASAEESAV